MSRLSQRFCDVVAQGATAVSLPVLALELSDNLNRRQFSVTIVPLMGGAGVSVGGGF